MKPKEFKQQLKETAKSGEGLNPKLMAKAILKVLKVIESDDFFSGAQDQVWYAIAEGAKVDKWG